MKKFIFVNVPLHLVVNKTNEPTSLNDQMLDHSVDHHKLAMRLLVWLLLL